VANADGVFDDEERRTFEASSWRMRGTVAPQPIAALVTDLGDLLQEDGLDRRVEMIARTVTKKEHGREILRVAALLAQVSDDVSPVERDVLAKLAKECKLDASEWTRRWKRRGSPSPRPRDLTVQPHKESPRTVLSRKALMSVTNAPISLARRLRA